VKWEKFDVFNCQLVLVIPKMANLRNLTSFSATSSCKPIFHGSWHSCRKTYLAVLGSYFCELRSFYQLILANLANQKSWWSIKTNLQRGGLHFVHPVKTFKFAHIPQNVQKTSLLEDESIRRVNIANPILLVFFITHIYNKNYVWEVVLLNHFHLQCFLGKLLWIREMFSLTKSPETHLFHE